MKASFVVPMALVVFAVLAQTGLKPRLYVPLYAQDAPTANSLTFEVASVKANKSGDLSMMFRNEPGGRFTVTNVPLKEIIRVAFALQPFQIVGGPDWIGTERFDIVAKAEGNVTPLGPPGSGPSPTAQMLQNLLADRFKMKSHRETREMPVYALVLARADGKLGKNIERPAVDCAARRGGPGAAGRGAPQGPPTPPKPGERPPCGAFMGLGSIAAGSMGMAQLATMLSQRVGRTVIDKTGLDGLWAFNLDFAPELPQGAGPLPPGVQLPAADPNAPSLYTALQEQLGLKLDSTRGPVEMLVIDNVDHPTED